MKERKIYFLVLLFIGSLFSSCSPTDDEVWFTKDETFCAEAWVGEDWVTTSPSENAKMWLEQQGVDVLEVEYDPEGTTTQVCNACQCLSGGVFRVQADATFTEIMLEEGFTLE